MHLLSALKIPLAGALGLAAFVLAANADPLPSKWGTALKDFLPVWDKACTGDSPALQSMKDGIRQTNHPAIKNLLYVLLISKECKVYTGHTAETRALLEEAALVDQFPIAQSNLGGCYIRGDCGFRQDLKKGEKLLRDAAYGGYGRAAAYLASEYATQKHFPLQVDNLILAKNYLDLAEREGVDSQLINTTRGELAEAENNPEKALQYYKSIKPTPYVTSRIKAVEQKVAEKAAEAENIPVFAALAASTGDGGYGFSFDQPSSQEAEARAMAECKSRNAGGNCGTKLVLEGRGCAAYSYAPGGSPFGWGTSREKDTAVNRAANECRTRNGNRGCSGGTVWACNTRTNDPVKVVYEAENDSKAETQVASETCRTELRQICTNWIGSTFNGHLQGSVTVFSFNDSISFPGCSQGEKGRLSFNWYKGKWGSWSGPKKVSPEVLDHVQKMMFAYRDKVIAKYPQCGNKETALVAFATAEQHAREKNSRRCTNRPEDLRRKDDTLIWLCID